jgi:hypothetical protein
VPLWPGASRREQNHDKAENEGTSKQKTSWVKQKGRHAIEQRGRGASRSSARNQRNNFREY